MLSRSRLAAVPFYLRPTTSCPLPSLRLLRLTMLNLVCAELSQDTPNLLFRSLHFLLYGICLQLEMVQITEFHEEEDFCKKDNKRPVFFLFFLFHI